METGFMNRIIGLVLALVVGGLLVGGLLIPSIEGMTATEGTITNDGYFHMQKITADDTTEYTLFWDKATDTFTLNGNVVDIGDHSQFNNDLGVSIAMTDLSVSRYVTGVRVQTWVSGIGGSFGYSGSTMTINFNNGTETITVDAGLETESSRTATYEYAYFISNEGSYEMKDKTKTAAVLSDSEVYAVGVTYIDNSTNPDTPVLSVLKMTGNASNVEFSAIYGLQSAPTFNDVEIHKTANAQYVGVYDLEKVTATVTYDSADTDITYSYFIVPAEVTAEKAQHMDATQIAMFGVISILGIVALVVVAANGIRNKY